jgi:hypothetical protein
MSLIPQEILSAIGGAAVTTIVAVVASGIRGIPFKLMIGNQNKNGKTLITKEMLTDNCKLFHEPLVEKITGIYDRQTAVLEQVANMQGYLEGKLGRMK